MTYSEKPFTKRTKLLLFTLLLAASFFRFYNLNWDEGHFFHPDERNIANAVSGLIFFSQMDPKFYAYGGFLIYLYKGTVDLLSLLFQNPPLSTDWSYINLIGRYYSAFFSTMTLIPLFLLTRKLFTEKTAFLTCLLYVFTVSSIQTAHFSITENFLTLSLVTMTYLSLLLYEKPTFIRYFLIGLLLGITVATKTTGISYTLLPFITTLLLLTSRRSSLGKGFAGLAGIGGLAFLVFSLFSPFTFLNMEKFLESMRFENSVVLGTNPVVYTLQFTSTLPYLFQIQNLFWQLGPVMLASLFGIILLLKNLIKSRKAELLIFLSFPLIYFMYVGGWHTKFIRYMVPLLPFFLISASIFLLWMIKKWRYVGIGLTSLCVGITILWALTFFSIYTRPQTRVIASEWIYINVPRGSVLYSEHWDEGLPIPLLMGSPDEYYMNQLTIYEPDNEAKISYYATSLARADYVTITTRRLYGTLLNLPDKYPLTSKYYELLFSGKLGFKKVKEFSSYPSLFGIEINDDTSEETFQVYDHPKVMIFRNTKRLSAEEITAVFKKERSL